MDASLEFYAVCPAGFEQIVSEELKSQGIKRIRPLKGGRCLFRHHRRCAAFLFVVA